MEEKESFGSGLAVKGDEAPDSYHIAPRTENTVQFSAPTSGSQAPAPAPAPVSVVAAPSTGGKKKRGRPRKYGPDGQPVALALSPMPISSSIPLTGDFSAWKRGRGRPVESIKKSYKYEFDSPSPGIKKILMFQAVSFLKLWSLMLVTAWILFYCYIWNSNLLLPNNLFSNDKEQ